MKRAFPFAVAIALSGSQPAVAHDPVQDALTAALTDSAAGWNTGDLDRFFAVYECGTSTTYVSHGALVVGTSAIRGSYALRFNPASGDLGKLSIQALNVRRIGRDHALLIGRYHVLRVNGSETSGITSLIFHHGPRGWKIIADQSS